jgi:N-acetylmuramoyl-L-alanine amidase
MNMGRWAERRWEAVPRRRARREIYPCAVDGDRDSAPLVVRNMTAPRVLTALAALAAALAAPPYGAELAAARAPAPVVVIDPGHPSETSSGAVVQHGTTEVHVAWRVALGLRRELESRGYRVVMTKSRERELVRNRERARIANDAGAALMIRLHCDASTERGYALYFPDRAGTAEGRTGPTPDVMRASRAAADSIHAGMAERLRGVLVDGGVRGDSRTYVGGRQGALTGSIFSEVPVVTVEMVVLSDASDARFAKSSAGVARLAAALADGVGRYVPLRGASSTSTGSGT